MVRTYRRKTDRCNISETAVQSAITDIIRNGISLREAAFNYNLSRSTLFDRLKRYKKNEEEMRDKIPTKMVCQSKYASRQIFNDKEEEELREYLIQCSSSHFGLSYKTTRKLAYDFAKQSEKKYPASWDLNRLAGDDWMYGFMKRNPQLSLRKPENTSLARSTAFNKKNVEIFFNNYKTIQQKYKFSPDRIINLDEIGISTVLQAPRIIAECGKKQVGQVVTGERGTLVTFVGIIKEERLKKMKQQKKNTVKKQVFTERKPIVENKKSKKRKSRNQSSSDSEELCNEYEKIAKEMQQDSDMDIDIAEVDYTDQVESMKIITGNYILAEFPTKKTIKYFVGKVLNVGENEYEVSFLRKSRNNGFVYPTVDDISNVMEMDIVMKLPEPLSHKGTSRTERLIKFGINLDHYNVS